LSCDEFRCGEGTGETCPGYIGADEERPTVAVEVVAAAAGAAILVLVWLSVLRTVFVPRLRSSRAARWTVRALVSVTVAAIRFLPRRVAGPVLDFCAPLSLFMVASIWLAGTAAGFDLIAVGAGASASFPTLEVQGFTGALTVATLISMALVCGAFWTHLVRFIEAYDRRERPVVRLAHELPKSTGDHLLTICLRTTPRDRIDDHFREWAAWFNDVHATHLSFPALMFARPAGTLSWPSAAIVALDVAALIKAVAPNWAPGQTGHLLESGSTCVQRLADRLGITLPATALSFQGREELVFTESVRVVTDAGLDEERDRTETWADFQRIRSRYAPYATAISYHLRYEDGAITSSGESAKYAHT
jgi:hypothetical protein